MSDNESVIRFLEMVQANQQLYDARQAMLNTQALQTCCTATSDSILSDSWKYRAIVQPYDASFRQVKEPDKMKIDPKEFKYSRYTNEYDSTISEEGARDQMTDYWFESFDPLQICEVKEHYYLAGPDQDTSPTKRKFYNGSKWFQQFWDGRHGQKKEIFVKRHDISDPMWQELVVAMVVSGDFTLQQALYAVAVACDRCRHALLYKYREYHTYGDQGYSEESEKYQRGYAGCRFCR